MTIKFYIKDNKNTRSLEFRVSHFVRKVHYRRFLVLGYVSENVKIQNNKAVGYGKEAMKVNNMIAEVEQIIQPILETNLRPPSMINEIIRKVDLWRNGMIEKPKEKIYLNEWITRYYQAVKDGKILSKGQRLSTSTIDIYAAVSTYYKEYVGSDDIEINEADILNNMDRRVQHIQDMEEHFQGFLTFLEEEKEMAVSTRHVYFSKVKAALSHLKKKAGIEIPLGDTIAPKGVTKEMFWPNSLTKTILSHNERIRKSHRAVITAMKVQILCAMRPGDLLQLKESHFYRKEVQGQTLNMITYKNKKGNIVAQGTLPEQLFYEALATISKYGFILPSAVQPSLTSYKKNIRFILREYFGGDDIMVPFKHQKPNGEVVTEKVPVTTCTTPHTLRKAGITLLSRGLEKRVLEKYTGHSKGSVMIEKVYTGVGEEDLLEAQRLQETFINVEIK